MGKRTGEGNSIEERIREAVATAEEKWKTEERERERFWQKTRPTLGYRKKRE